MSLTWRDVADFDAQQTAERIVAIWPRMETDIVSWSKSELWDMLGIQTFRNWNMKHATIVFRMEYSVHCVLFLRSGVVCPYQHVVQRDNRRSVLACGDTCDSGCGCDGVLLDLGTATRWAEVRSAHVVARLRLPDTIRQWARRFTPHVTHSRRGDSVDIQGVSFAVDGERLKSIVRVDPDADLVEAFFAWLGLADAVPASGRRRDVYMY